MTTLKTIRNNMHILTQDNTKTLISYETAVASIDAQNNFNKLWDGYSATTMRHINEFRELNGLEKINKSIWINL